jgi:hypothetical protein
MKEMKEKHKFVGRNHGSRELVTEEEEESFG